MAVEYRAPENYPTDSHKPIIFLAGSIDMGKAEDWQSSLCQELAELDVMFLNPRRRAWDSSWEQSKSNPLFREQVLWELDGLDRATCIVMHLTAQSKAPISLLELGLYATSGRLIISCELGFWRRGNVEIICERYKIPLYTSRKDIQKVLRHRFGGNN